VDAPKFEMTAQWNLDHLLGYLQTWSSTQRFIAAHSSNPLEQVIDELRAAWGDSQHARNVTWPLVLRIGIKSSAESAKH
jgi:hypothetical protein